MDVFTGWIDLIAKRYAAAGLDAATARDLATALVVDLEGAFVLARAMRDAGPVELAGETLFSAVSAAQSRAGQEVQ